MIAKNNDILKVVWMKNGYVIISYDDCYENNYITVII